MKREIALERCVAWENMHRQYFPDYDQRWEEAVQAIALHTAQRATAKILDLGCGPGTLTKQLSDAITNATIVGFDADSLLIEIAQIAFETSSNLSFCYANILDLTTPQRLQKFGHFDVVVSSAFMHYFTTTELTQLHRILRTILQPDGVLITVEQFSNHDTQEKSEPQVEADPWTLWWSDTQRVLEQSGYHTPVEPEVNSTDPEPPLTSSTYHDVLTQTGFVCKEIIINRSSEVLVAQKQRVTIQNEVL